MTIFKKEEKNLNTLEKFINTLKEKNVKKEIIEYIININNNVIDNPFINDENLISVISFYIKLLNETNKPFDIFLIEIKNIFDKVYIDKMTSDFRNFHLFLNMFEVNGIYTNNYFDINLYRLFYDERNFYKLMDLIINNETCLKNFDKIVSFLLDIRSTYTSEESFFFDAVSFINKITIGTDINSLIEITTLKIEKMKGIYDLDETKLDLLEEKTIGAEGVLNELKRFLEKCSELSSNIDKRIASYQTRLEIISAENLEEYKSAIDGYLREIKDLALTVKDELNRYNLEKRKEASEYISELTIKKQEELNKESEKIMASLKSFGDTLSALALRETSLVTKAGNDQIASLNNFIRNHEDIKELLSSVVPNKEILALLKDFIEASKTKEQNNSIVNNSLRTTETGNLLIPPMIITEKPVDMNVNRYFDKRVSFTSRMNELIEKMEQNKEKGILYHKQTIKALTALLEDVTPYLYGPSGAGKSTLVVLLSDLLDLPYINTGYINEEYQAVGAEPFLGSFKPSVVHECFKYGKIAFIDEFDNGNPKANIILNPFLRHSEEYYTFSNGEKVLRHPNFRVIAAGNTTLRGRTRNHSTREAFEESIRQRLKPFIFIDYDDTIEQSILKNKPEWYKFIKKFRQAQSTYSENDGEITMIDAITTSDIANIDKFLKDKAFDIDDIIEMEFIKAKEKEYLNHIINELKIIYEENKPERKEQEIYMSFQKEAKKYLKRGL